MIRRGDTVLRLQRLEARIDRMLQSDEGRSQTVFDNDNTQSFLEVTFPWMVGYFASHVGIRNLAGVFKVFGWSEKSAHFDIGIQVNKNSYILMRIKPSGMVYFLNPRNRSSELGFEFLFLSDVERKRKYRTEVFVVNLLHFMVTNYELCFPMAGNIDYERLKKLARKAVKDEHKHYGTQFFPAYMGFMFNPNVRRWMNKYGPWMLDYLVSWNGPDENLSKIGFTELYGDAFILIRRDVTAVLKDGVVAHVMPDGTLLLYRPEGPKMQNINTAGEECTESIFVNTLNLAFMFPTEFFGDSKEVTESSEYLDQKRRISSSPANYGPIPLPKKKNP